MEKNWKNIGPVTVYCVDNIVGKYDDIRDFIRGNRWIASNKMTDVVRYSDFSDAILTRRAASLDKSYFYTGDRFHLRDDAKVLASSENVTLVLGPCLSVNRRSSRTRSCASTTCS